MQPPERDAVRMAAPTTAPMSRWEAGEQIPWMSWSIALVWVAASEDAASFLAAQPALRALAAGASFLVAPVEPDAALRAALGDSPLGAEVIRACWVLAYEHGRLDEDVTTATEHVLLVTDAHLIYAASYRETLH